MDHVSSLLLDNALCSFFEFLKTLITLYSFIVQWLGTWHQKHHFKNWIAVGCFVFRQALFVLALGHCSREHHHFRNCEKVGCFVFQQALCVLALGRSSLECQHFRNWNATLFNLCNLVQPGTKKLATKHISILRQCLRGLRCLVSLHQCRRGSHPVTSKIHIGVWKWGTHRAAIINGPSLYDSTYTIFSQLKWKWRS